jgi:protein Tex
MLDLIARIATDIHAKPEQVRAAVELIDGGATVPFIARYRKEATGGLDDTQLRGLEERLIYLRELNERREAILKSIDEQGKLNDALRAEILGADSKARLEDLYLPYKPKRRTKAEIAREAGLEPLADGLLNDPARDPSVEAAAFVAPDRGIADVKAALDGAKSILVERFAEDPALVGELREWLWSNGQIVSTLIEGKDKSGAKFADYFSHAEPLGKAPSHRVLALLRARNEGVIDLVLAPLSAALKFGVTPTDDQLSGGHAFAEGRIATRFGVAERGRAADGFLRDAVRQAWRHKLHVHLSLDLIGRARSSASTRCDGALPSGSAWLKETIRRARGR